MGGGCRKGGRKICSNNSVPDLGAFSVNRGAKNKVNSENIAFSWQYVQEQKEKRVNNIMEGKSS